MYCRRTTETSANLLIWNASFLAVIYISLSSRNAIILSRSYILTETESVF